MIAEIKYKANGKKVLISANAISKEGRNRQKFKYKFKR